MQKLKVDVPYWISMALIFVLILSMVISCSPYKSTWSCKFEKGFGCTSVAYADEIARKEIILNDSLHLERSENGENKVLITRHYADLELKNEQEIPLER